MSRRSFESANQTKKKQPVTLPESEASSEDSTSCSDDDAEYKEPSRKRSGIRRNESVTGKNCGNAKKKATDPINDRNTSPESKASSEEPSSTPSESRKRPRSTQQEVNPSKRTKIWTAEAAELFKEHKFWTKTMSKKFVKEYELSSEQLRSFLKKHRTAERKKLGLSEKEYKEKYPESAAPGYDEDDEADDSEPRVWTNWAKIGPIARELFSKHKYWSPEMTAEFQKEHNLSEAQLHSFLKKRRREDMKKLNLSREEYEEKFYDPFKRALERREKEEKEQEGMAQEQMAQEDTENDVPDVSNYKVWTSEARRIFKTHKFWSQEFTAEFQKEHNVGKEQLHSFLKKCRERERKKLGNGQTMTPAEYKKLFPIPAYNQEIHRGKNGQFVSVPAKRKIERGQETDEMDSKRGRSSEKPDESEDEDVEDSEGEGHEEDAEENLDADRFYDVQYDDPVYDNGQMEEFVQEQDDEIAAEGAGHVSDDDQNTTELHETGSDCGFPHDSPYMSDDDDTDVPPPVPPHRYKVDFGKDQDLVDAGEGDEQDEEGSGGEQELEDEENVPEHVQIVSEEASNSLQNAQEATMDEEDQKPEQDDDDGDDLVVASGPTFLSEPSPQDDQQVQVQPADPQNDENEPIRQVQQIRRVHFADDEQLERVRFISPRREVEEDDDYFSPDASPEACYQHLEEPEVQVEVEPAVALPSHSNQLSFEDQEEIEQLGEEDRLTKEDSFAAEHQESCEPVIAREEPVPTVKAPKRGRKRGRCGRQMTTAKEVSAPAPVPIVEGPAVDPEEKPLIPIPLKRDSRYDKPQPPPCQFVQLDRPLGDFAPWFMQENWKSGVFSEDELKKGITESDSESDSEYESESESEL